MHLCLYSEVSLFFCLKREITAFCFTRTNIWSSEIKQNVKEAADLNTDSFFIFLKLPDWTAYIVSTDRYKWAGYLVLNFWYNHLQSQTVFDKIID